MIKESKFHQKLVSHSTIDPKMTTAKQNFKKDQSWIRVSLLHFNAKKNLVNNKRLSSRVLHILLFQNLSVAFVFF